jgi:hypothetical protein
MKLSLRCESTVMKKVLSFVGVVFGTALMYATLSCLISLVFCLSYKEVAQFPGMVFLGGMLALAAGIILGIAIDESDL